MGAFAIRKCEVEIFLPNIRERYTAEIIDAIRKLYFGMAGSAWADILHILALQTAGAVLGKVNANNVLEPQVAESCVYGE